MLVGALSEPRSRIRVIARSIGNARGSQCRDQSTDTREEPSTLPRVSVDSLRPDGRSWSRLAARRLRYRASAESTMRLHPVRQSQVRRGRRRPMPALLQVGTDRRTTFMRRPASREWSPPAVSRHRTPVGSLLERLPHPRRSAGAIDPAFGECRERPRCIQA